LRVVEEGEREFLGRPVDAFILIVYWTVLRQKVLATNGQSAPPTA
jgi:hypothetical protein